MPRVRRDRTKEDKAPPPAIPGWVLVIVYDSHDNALPAFNPYFDVERAKQPPSRVTTDASKRSLDREIERAMMGVADNTDAAQAAQADQAHKLVVYFVPDSQHAHDVLQWIEKKGASQPVSHENKLRLAAVAAWNDPHWIQRASR